MSALKAATLGAFCLAALGAASALASEADNAAIIDSFIKNRFTIDKRINLNKPYWSADRLNIFSDGEFTICSGDPTVFAGSGLMHDVKNDPVGVGEAGWLDHVDSVDVCEQQGFEAWIDGEAVETLDSGCHKFENFISDPALGENTNWTWNADGEYATGCDWHFETRPAGRPELWGPRENGENCWARTVGLDVSNLEPGEYTVRTLFTQVPGHGPADATGSTYDQTHLLTVIDCMD
jgi:hypothetical protein